MADWGALAGFAAAAVAGLSFWKAKEANEIAKRNQLNVSASNELATKANEIAQSSNSYSREANAQSELANELSNSAVKRADKANEIAERALRLEFEPQLNVCATIGTTRIEDRHVPLFVMRATNNGRLPLALESAKFRFLPSKSQVSEEPLLIENHERGSVLPFLLEPGHSAELLLDGRQVGKLFDFRISKGDTEFQVVFSDKTGTIYNSETDAIASFLQVMDWFRRLFHRFYGLDKEGKSIPREEWAMNGLQTLLDKLPDDENERYELLTFVFQLIGYPKGGLPPFLVPSLSRITEDQTKLTNHDLD